MGKGTDKLFITHSEWSSGGHSMGGGADSVKVDRTVSKLPFWTCSISQQPIGENCGVADVHGHVYDIKNVFPYIRKHSRNPVTHEPMESHNELIKLKLTKNAEGKYVDPVTLKEFQTLSDVVLIRPSGRVYFEQTIRENNIKQRFWRDLVSDEEFKKADIIKLIGGAGVRKSTIATKKKESMSTKASTNLTPSAPTLTSTAADAPTGPTAREREIELERQLKPKRFTETGYATIETELGTLNVELYPKYSPKAVYNFVKLAQQGYFDGISFHRNIKHFMIQTGDPTGTGSGGKSIFGKPFADETNTPMKHDDRGVLAMANKGKNTNTSQFFITYRRCPHLDGKHTVFGKVVGGLDVLDKLERLPVREDDTPIQPIHMQSVKIQIDPFGNMSENKSFKDTSDETIDDDTPWLKRDASKQLSIGKYLKRTNEQQKLSNTDESEEQDDDLPKKRKKTTLSQSTFAAW
ncbi:hypothetical protein TRICI_005727 [Trichomonascus ciferrii]|uniref:PPIase cyclophilin-type domain-containing protein n=1 Tax=Trichomonascus ciferrii TaxID=44093 RepID=A0A642UQB6_9ASCO|nr:hypothetical protein TRICI_005727 [Trichomonascus ciferrii]